MGGLPIDVVYFRMGRAFLSQEMSAKLYIDVFYNNPA